jgi:N-sulfoglucosamine sulfohydrolase
VYPWTVFDDIETRDSAQFGDHCDAFFTKAKDSGKPFNLVVGFHDPHRDQSRGGFANNKGPFDPRVKDIDVKLEDVEVPEWLTDVPELRQELAEYYRAIYRFDQGVGFILDNLEKQGLADSTLVIITADNGPPFINAKTTLYDSGTCLPFMIRDPRLVAQGIQGLVNPNMVSFLDILPTMLDYAGLPLDLRTKKLSPDRLGRSILPILGRTDVVAESEWPQHIFGSHTYHERANYWPTRVLRTRKWKYHRNVAWRLDFPFATDLYSSLSFEGMRNMQTPVFIGKRSLRDYIFRPAECLYNLENDPLELNNLAGDPAHKETLTELRKRLEAWQRKTEDIWLYKDGQSVKGLEVWLGTDEMMMPDRCDFDVDQPGLNAPGVELMKVVGDPVGIRGATLYGGQGRKS